MEYEPSVSIDASSIMPDPSLSVDASAKFVTVSNGARRVEAPDGEGYLMQVESGPANGIPDGRYDLSKAIEARAQVDRAYDGQVVHKEGDTIYQMAGHEIVKHSMFELAKEKLPEIGAQIALSYAGGLPHVDMASQGYTAASAAHPHKPVDHTAEKAIYKTIEQGMEGAVQNMQAHHAGAQAGTTQAHAAASQAGADTSSVADQTSSSVPDVRKQAADNIDKVFRNQPGNEASGAASEAAANSQLAAMRAKIDADPAYGQEIHRQHPDLFQKAASPEAQENMRKAIELAERADQAKTVAGKDEKKPEDGNKASSSNGDEKEREKRGFSMPGPIKTSAEARAQSARETLTRAQALAPMFAAKQMREHTPKHQGSNAATKANTQQAKRSRSR